MLKLIILLTLLFSGVVFSAPEDPQEREQYTASLNSMASIVMSWYSKVLDKEKQLTKTARPDHWQEHMTQYPDGVSQLKIISTDLSHIETTNQYRFSVGIKLRNKQENKIQTRSMSDTFLFGFDTEKHLVLQEIISTKAQASEVISENKFTTNYFKNREVAYAWLSYLDGATLPEDIAKKFDQVQYSVTIGKSSLQGMAIDVLNERESYLAVGGHILREVKVKPFIQSSDIHVVNLTIEWRGVDKDNTPVWANIKQKIKYRLFNNGDWEIISVNEKHTIPDTDPWVRLLC